MLAQNPAGGALHSFHIQRCIQCVNIARLPGRANLSAKDSIFIGFCLGTVPCMEIAC